jgi:Domain of unknown function (DUF6259)
VRRVWLSLVGALAGLCASVFVTQGDARPADRDAEPPVVTFKTSSRDRLVLTTADLRLSLSKKNGALIELVDRRTGDRLVRDQRGCAWTVTLANLDAQGGCAFSPAGDNRFAYRWAPSTSTLTLRYDAPKGRGVDATVTVTVREAAVDLRLVLETSLDRPIAAVHFPADLAGEVATVAGVYTPTFLPGIRLLPSFFASPHRNVERYPSRWAFADFIAADVGRSHVALYSVNPPPSPVAPVDLGVVYDAPPATCSGPWFCLTHVFQTWVTPGSTWTSPTVRLRVGGSVAESIRGYRVDSGIEEFPSLEAKLGKRLDVLERAPLIKIDPWKGLPPFREWGPSLRRLPSPSLLHPVAFQARGHDEDFPDFLPPDPRWGTTAAFNRALGDARSLGHIVMPYLNVSWWDTQAPSIRGLPPPLTARDISMQTQTGAAVTEQFGNRDGYIVSPYALAVRDRVERLMEEWRNDVPVECLFFDQIGARPWRRDFNPAAPNPLAYADGWLDTFAPFRDRCLMTEDGWDRLADSFVGFHGGALEMEREVRWQSERFGAANWEPYPIALWLLHDKVLMYQHDLYEGTMTSDPEVLTFNLAFGLQLSYNWDGISRSLDSQWLSLVGRIQQTVGPHVAGSPLTSYRRLTADVSESVFEDYSVVANWNRTVAFDIDGYQIAPLGFLARSNGNLLAGAFGGAWRGVTVVPPLG